MRELASSASDSQRGHFSEGSHCPSLGAVLKCDCRSDLRKSKEGGAAGPLRHESAFLESMCKRIGARHSPGGGGSGGGAEAIR